MITRNRIIITKCCYSYDKEYKFYYSFKEYGRFPIIGIYVVGSDEVRSGDRTFAINVPTDRKHSNLLAEAVKLIIGRMEEYDTTRFCTVCYNK